jgi:uncharacterized protein YukJ
MLRVELIPDLSHCIETVAKREHTAVSKQLLASGQRNKELEEKLEVLKFFLETADFKKLRAESEKRLMEGRKVKFLVYRDKGVKCEMQVT